jgi:RNA polymerase sigma factor (sigma-70 family)
MTRRLSRRSDFCRSDERDLEQRLWLALLKEAERFDPQRASLNTFIDRVVHTAAGMIVRSWYRQKRAPDKGTLSLDRTKVAISGDINKPLAQFISGADLSRRTGTTSNDETARREEAEAVTHALDTIPEELRDVCRHVMGGTISSAARDLEMSRRQVRKALQQARPYFERAGLNGQ